MSRYCHVLNQISPRRLRSRMLVGLAMVGIANSICGNAIAGVPILLDDFNNGTLDPQWVVTFPTATMAPGGGNANGWTFSESGGELVVTGISTIATYCNNNCPGWGNVWLTRPVPYLSDFHVDFDIGWDSLGTAAPVQRVFVYLIGADNSNLAFVAYHDAWGLNGGEVGEQWSGIGGSEFHMEPNTLPLAGAASIDIDRVGSDVTVRWDGNIIHTGTAAQLLAKVRIEFSYFDDAGASVGGVTCPATLPGCSGSADRPRSTFGVESVDLIEVQGTPMPVRYVNHAATGLNNGSSWADAYTQLQDALADAAASGGVVDEIWVAKGTYKPDRGTGVTLGDRTATFQLQNGVAVYGGFNGTETLLSQRNPTLNTTILNGDLLGNDTPVPCLLNFPDCDFLGGLCVNGFCIISSNNAENSQHIITGSGTDVTAFLDGFTISGGNADLQNGAGMNNVAGSPTVNNCTFTGNTAFAGGAVFNGSGSAPRLTNCQFRGNSGPAGGAMHNNNSSPNMIDCTFDRNASEVGGGMQNFNASSPHVINCTFCGNLATNSGGGIYSSSGGPKVISCLFSGNVANNGGGLSNAGNAVPTITNSTFSRNAANTDGGGIYNASSGNPTAINCIVWGNSDAGGMDESAQIHTASGAPTVNYTIVQGGWSGAGGNNSSADPLFFDPDGVDNSIGTLDDDLRLRTGSPAIDTGNTASVPADTLDLDGDLNVAEPIPFDLAGNARFIGTVDMGAYEYFPDCNNNSINDALDIANLTSEDCDASAGWPANGIPDECDIASCPDGNFSCDDCNLNGVPDRCDIVSLTSDDADSNLIPDECAPFSAACTEPGEEDFWTCGANWPALGGFDYPDNIDSAPGVSVLLPTVPSPRSSDTPGLPAREAQAARLVSQGGSADVFLDETVEILTLDIEPGSQLRITQSGAEGDLNFSAPGVLNSRGAIVMSGPRAIGAAGILPTVTFGPGSTYQADSGAIGVIASIDAASLTVSGSDCFVPPCPDGGQVTLTDSMSVTTTGNLTIDGRLANGDCFLRRDGNAALLSFHTPPSIRVLGPGTSISVGAVFSMQGAAVFLHESLVPVTVGGDWDNQSVRPLCFDSTAGVIRMDGMNPQAFEVAAIDTGGTGGSSNDFRLGALEIAAGRDVTVRDTFDNDLLGQASCGEAQYVDTLVLEAGASLTVQNCRLYFDALVKDPSAQINLEGCGEVRSAVNPDSGQADPTGLSKSRAISFVPPPGAIAAGGGGTSAIRVTLASLHRVDPPYSGGPSVPFSSFEGQVRWVGPPSQYAESTSNPTPFRASNLQCTPYYQDWSTVGLLHVFGSAIVPSSSYRVQMLADSCQGIEDRCTAVSSPLTVMTTRWGDVETPYNPPSPTVQPDVGDISSLVNKFRSSPGAPIKARALLAGDDAFGNINNLDIDLGFGHIAACVDAFRGRPYPHAISSCP